MYHNRKKLTKIVEELTMDLFAVGATDISSNIKITKEQSVITVSSNYHPDYKEKCKKFAKLLSIPRDECMENEYWSLAGSGEIDEASELLLVGIMTDDGDLEITDDTVTITLIRKN